MNTINAIHLYLKEQGYNTTISPPKPTTAQIISIHKPNHKNYIRLKINNDLIIFPPAKPTITINLNHPNSLQQLTNTITTILNMTTHHLPDKTVIDTIHHNETPLYRINNGKWTPSTQSIHKLNQTEQNTKTLQEFLEKENNQTKLPPTHTTPPTY